MIKSKLYLFIFILNEMSYHPICDYKILVKLINIFKFCKPHNLKL